MRVFVVDHGQAVGRARGPDSCVLAVASHATRKRRMVIKPRIWGFICTSAHPDGCAANVASQVARIRTVGVHHGGPRNVLVIGASTGYGLASRITAAFGFGAATLGVFLEKPGSSRRPASAGWYNTASFTRQAQARGIPCLSLNGDAFAAATRERAIGLIREQMGGTVDLVIYSVAAARRVMPDGTSVHTAVKPIGETFAGTTVDLASGTLCETRVEPATPAEIVATTAVMGGDGWRQWIHALDAAGVLAADARTVAFSYIGPQATWPIYRHGTLGRAKRDLEQAAGELAHHFSRPDFARVAVLKSIVTQSSAAIPVIPLYLASLFKVMKARGLHEDALDQQQRLFRDWLYPQATAPAPDEEGRLRLDDRELDASVQAACQDLWSRVDGDNFLRLTDFIGYRDAFAQQFGFALDGIDYDADVDPQVSFPCATP